MTREAKEDNSERDSEEKAGVAGEKAREGAGEGGEARGGEERRKRARESLPSSPNLTLFGGGVTSWSLSSRCLNLREVEAAGKSAQEAPREARVDNSRRDPKEKAGGAGEGEQSGR
ncbi:Hypothetical predicted protein [Xyrichtys novacula]|uniref:Uncharacterized protein n=1 Tax=Xyrichtys novacula TaxID=13765 RepID=A0AAV1H3V4_XYRNO|nr:Hypothetical predicted protein [Xyrichtys novacula]